ncbi:hypothetical protein JCM19237_5882 [Photobacterium aphoticum]|uniref:Uncharacterized protein n=1 Tax=Photobacterium aphoticum TaxID=754436 RepID=A0A090QMI8_9GAMM|nr:hypothetical protein JCM19237_5882 [Photobacterium aphoticum]
MSFTVHDTTVTLHDFQLTPPSDVDSDRNERHQTLQVLNTAWQLRADSAHIQLPPSLNQALSPVTTAGFAKDPQNGS